jgi:hypothetical protein
MAGPERSHVIAQDLDTVASNLYNSLFLQILLQHASSLHSESAHSAHSADARDDGRSEWHRFLDGLCFLCDFKRAGKSVVSIGVEQGTGRAIFWITTNVIVGEADQYGKRITPARYFRVIIEILRDTLSFLLVMPTYSKEDLTNALAAYRNREFTSIRKCAYAFNIPYSTLAFRLSTRTSRSQSHESQQILSTAEEKTLLKAITRLSKSGCPITLPLTRDLTEEIRLSRFRLSSSPTSYPPISKR